MASFTLTLLNQLIAQKEAEKTQVNTTLQEIQTRKAQAEAERKALDNEIAELCEAEAAKAQLQKQLLAEEEDLLASVATLQKLPEGEPAPAPGPPVTDKFVFAAPPIYMRTAMDRARLVDWSGKRVTLNPLVTKFTWNEFACRTWAKEPGKIRIQRIREALEIALKTSSNPTVKEINDIILARHHQGHKYPLQSGFFMEEFITGPNACPHTWLYYMKHQGLITITPPLPF
jgi:hypothetical protein